MAHESWILQVRDRLTDPPPRRLAMGNGSGRVDKQLVVLVPIYVDAGELWTIFLQEQSSGLALTSHTYPAQPNEGPDPWTTAARIAQQALGVGPEQALRLGELNELEGPGDSRLRPCVVAIPTPEENLEAAVQLPLSAIANPRLVEEQELEIEGQVYPATIYHVGRHRLWGPSLEIALGFWQRIGAS